MKNRCLRLLVALVIAASIATTALSAQSAAPVPSMRGDGPAPAPKPVHITRSDPGLDQVVDANTTAELLATGFGLNEGPVWVREGQSGYLIVGGLLDNVLYRIAADKTVSVFMEQAGYTGNDVNHTGTQTRSGRSHVLLIGPSCASLDSQGRLIWCADNDRTVMRLEKDGKTRTVLSSGSNDGKRFSGPNDIVVAKDDAVYLTDNDFGLRDGGKNPDKQLENGIWRIKDGKSTMVLEAKVLGGIPNGIVLSPDEKYLYANAGQRMFRYEMKPDGSLGPGSLFSQGPGIGDGMKVDTLGNVYSTSGAGPGIVRITAPSGTLLGYLNLPIVGGEPKRQICATNVAFGDLDGKSLYVTACDHVYRIRLKVEGVMPGPAKPAR
jgi:gluconolactonase